MVDASTETEMASSDNVALIDIDTLSEKELNELCYRMGQKLHKMVRDDALTGSMLNNLPLLY